MNTREVRYVSSTEVRAMGGSGDADPLRIEGYASVFNTRAQLPKFQERIKPGAFTRSIAQKQDVVCLFNHDSNIVLGRTTSGTLRLTQDSRGLSYVCDLPNTQTARDIHESIKRGDINGCSFAFNIPDGGQEWNEERDADGKFYILRDITDVNLMDVSPVTYPCYSGTDVYARTAEAPMELRSAVDAKNKALEEVAVVPPVIEKRDAADGDDCYEDEICEVSSALREAFPAPGAEAGYDGPCYSGRFYCVETYDDYVIVSECMTGEFFKISYTEDEATEVLTFGTPEPVEKVYVPSERAVVRFAEYRKSVTPAAKRDISDDTEEELEEIEEEYDLGLIGRACDESEMPADMKTRFMEKICPKRSKAIEIADVVVPPAVEVATPLTKDERAKYVAGLERGFDVDSPVRL